METAEITTLIDKLIERSRERKIDWRETGDADTYLAQVRGTSFKTLIATDSWGNPDSTEVSMISETGTELWSLNTRKVDEGTAEKIRTLHSLAKEKALKVNEKIAAALKTLDNL